MLDLHLVYPLETNFTGFGYGGYVTIGAGGQGLLFLSTWMRI
jgi:hypothetical protein